MPKEDFHKKEAGMFVGNFEMKIYNFVMFLRVPPINTKTLNRYKYDSVPYRAWAVWSMTSS